MRYEVARHLLRRFFGPRRSTAWLWTQRSWRHHTCQELRTRTVNLRQLSAMVYASVIVYSLSNECHHSKCYCRTVLDTALSVQFLPGPRNASYSFRMVTTILVGDTVSTACSSSCTGVSSRSSCAPLRAMEDFHVMKRRQRSRLLQFSPERGYGHLWASRHIAAVAVHGTHSKLEHGPHQEHTAEYSGAAPQCLMAFGEPPTRASIFIPVLPHASQIVIRTSFYVCHARAGDARCENQDYTDAMNVGRVLEHRFMIPNNYGISSCVRHPSCAKLV